MPQARKHRFVMVWQEAPPPAHLVAAAKAAAVRAAKAKAVLSGPTVVLSVSTREICDAFFRESVCS